MNLVRTTLLLVCGLLIALPTAYAQNAFVQGFNPGGQQAGIGNNPGGNGLGQGQGQGQGNGFPGGAANADFDSLMDLISSTVGADTWVDNGGTAEMRPFPGGVWVDPAGVLRQPMAVPTVRLTSLETPALPSTIENEDSNPRSAAKLRCVSLPRLEAEIVHRIRDGKPLEESMLALAGLQSVDYLFVYPEIGDVVIAGPAGDWQVDRAGRLASVDTGSPIVRLDDLLTLLRRERKLKGKPFGCSITPRQENLAATQAYLDKSSATPLKPGTAPRNRWLDELRTTLGRQDIEVFGLAAGTHAAHVLVEADHHMKRIGIGLDEGVVGVDSYLTTVAREKNSQPLSVLRWWFSTNYQGVARNDSQTAFELVGQGVCVLSENELLTKRGERIHTNQADDATQQFAHQFTIEFEALCEKYPVYGELRNLFDLSIIAALLDSEDLYATAGWQPVLFLNDKHLPLPNYRAPKEVDTILNHTVIDKTKIIAAVSGGVWIDSKGVLLRTESQPSEKLEYHRNREPLEATESGWWWDLE